MKSELNNKKYPVPVIDLFAGPGGLAEGFSSVLSEGARVFKIKLSVEKEYDPHKTLQLRSFCRQFEPGYLPEEYYEMLRQPDEMRREKKIDSLFIKYPSQFNDSKAEAWQATLGSTHFPPEMIDKRISKCLAGYSNWVLIGGPPCQAYSLAGRSRVGGISEEDHRIYLYKEYLRIIAVHQPAVFVMENVKGLLSAEISTGKVFNKIIEDLRNPSIIFHGSLSRKYRIYSLVKEVVKTNSDYLIKSEFYGIPQKRHRVILLGIREDIDIIPPVLKARKMVSLQSVIGNLPVIRSGLNRRSSGFVFNGDKKMRQYLSVTDSPQLWEKYINQFKQEILQWNGLTEFPDTGLVYSPEYETGAEYLPVASLLDDKHPLKSWYNDPRFTGITHHKSRSHLTDDLFRYMFAAIFSSTLKRFPRLSDYRKYSSRLLPDHENASSGIFNDRFRVQMPLIPASTITSHISKDGHYFIHYDSSQCRTLTVREAARIQTFPDNYLFRGSRTSQYHQVGNAVPPFLAKQIGEIVFQVISQI